MTDFNIQIKKKNDDGTWKNLNPLTTSDNVIHSDGETSTIKENNNRTDIDINKNMINVHTDDISSLENNVGEQPLLPTWLNQPIFKTLAYLDDYVRGNYIDVTKEPYNVPTDELSDATLAIQNVLNNAPIRSTVFFPNGTYKLSGQLVMTRELTIKGSSVGEMGGTVFDFNLTSTTGEVIAFLIKSTAKNSNLENIYIKNSSANGVELQGLGNTKDDAPLTHFNVKDVWVINFTNNFIFRKIYLSRFYRCVARGGYRGFAFLGDSTSLVFEGCYANSCVENWFLHSVIYSSLISCASDHAERNGYRFVNCKGINLSACGAETALRSGFYFEENNVAITVIAGFTHLCGSAGSTQGTSVHVETKNKAIIINGFDENSQHPDSTASSIIFGDTDDSVLNGANTVGQIKTRPTVIVNGQRKHNIPPTTGLFRTGDIVYRNNFSGTGVYAWLRTGSSWTELTV